MRFVDTSSALPDSDFIQGAGEPGVGFEQFEQSDPFAAIDEFVSEVQVGRFRYKLRTPERGTFIPGSNEFIVPGFGQKFIGRGGSSDQAFDDWQAQIHLRVQELQAKRPFELTFEDRKDLVLLADQLDLVVHRNRTPIRVREFGTIVRKRENDRAIKVRWLSGRSEFISLDRIDHPPFLNIKLGQQFDAVVERDPTTYRLIKLVFAQSVKSVRNDTNADAAMMDRIGSTNRLKVSDRH